MSKARSTKSSGNVFADIGMPGAEEHLAKADLVIGIAAIIRSKGLSQTAAAKLIGIAQPDVSRLMRGRTVIAIAHRLATLRNFDRVVMLQGGRIIDDGPPDVLVKGKGPYRELVAREMGRLATHAA